MKKQCELITKGRHTRMHICTKKKKERRKGSRKVKEREREMEREMERKDNVVNRGTKGRLKWKMQKGYRNERNGIILTKQ